MLSYLAGGGGTRLWPMSRADVPKQLLPLVEESSMFRVSVERLAPLVHAGADLRRHRRKIRRRDARRRAGNSGGEFHRRALRQEYRSGGGAGGDCHPPARPAGDDRPADRRSSHRLQGEDSAASCKRRINWRRTITSSRWGFRRRCPSTGFGYIRRGEKMRDHRRIHRLPVARVHRKAGYANRDALHSQRRV